MKRGLWVLAGLGLVTALTWACWPGPEEGTAPTAASASAEPQQAARSLAEQLDEVDCALEGSDAGRGLVSGVVEDEAGLPIEGAEVRAFQAGGHALAAAVCPVCGLPILECNDLHTAHEVIEAVRAGRGQPRQLAVTTTGPDGTFRFEDLPQEELELTARQAGRFARGTHLPGEEALLMLSPPARLALRVMKGTIALEGSEVPLAGARVTAISLDTFAMQQTVSDGAGQLRLDGLDQGSGVWVLLEAPGLLPLMSTVYSDQDETQLALLPGRALVVRTTIGGKPAEATVTVIPGGGQHPIKQQTQGGSARFDGLDPQGCEVTASTGSMVAPNEAVSLELELTTFELELRAAAKLLVTVIDENGEPVANADLSAAGRGGDYHSGNTIDGALVVLGALGEGPISIEVDHPDFRPWHRDLDLHPGDNALEVVLRKGVKLTGKVLDPDGKPVLQAEIEARAPVTAPISAYSDFDGSFELTFDEPGPQELTASLNAAGRTTVTVHAPADGVVIRLEPRARLRVAVREGNAPVAGASVTVSPVRSDTNLNSVSDEAGVAMIAGLDPGTYEVTVHSPEFRQPPSAVVNLIDGRTVSIDVVLDRGLTISGRVVDARGAAVPGAEVSTEPWTGSLVSDEEGRFTFTALDPDASYKIEAMNESHQSASLRVKGPQPPVQLVLLPRPMVSGRVVDAATEAPLKQFEIDSQAIETPDGRFSVPQRAEGQRVMITIRAEGFETTSWEGPIGAGGELGTVRLPKAKVVEGVVRDARGSPVAGAVVTSDYIDQEVTSGTDGSFRLALSQFEPGSALVAQRGQLRGYAPIQLGRVIEIILVPPTRVTGQVIDSGGRPVAGVVRIREDSGSEELQAEAGSDGTFELKLAAGRWVFTTRASSSGQTFAVSGPSMGVVLGAPPGTCAVAVVTLAPADEVMLLPAELTPASTASFDSLATIEGAVLFDPLNSARVLRAEGLRCGPHNLVARWGTLQRVARIELRSGAINELQLAPPPELSASAPAPQPEAH